MIDEVGLNGTAPFYYTDLGAAYLGNSLTLMKEIKPNSIQLIMTSPPYALQKKKKYGNKPPGEYVDWFMDFAKEFKRIIKSDGSIVIDIGGSWVKGKPTKSLYQYELLLRLCSELELYLAQDMYWFNKAKLPSPAQWVTVNRWRLKDAVDQIFWLSKTPNPKANNKRVLKEYSKSMQTLLKNKNYYKPDALRPSGYRISDKFYTGNGGAIPPNFLEYSNTESNSKYSKLCRKYGITPHPARFPVQLPEFFINFLTDPEDIVLDPFAGSNVTGEAAQKWGRKWISIESEQSYLEGSLFRFFDETILCQKYDFK
jgi:site-specific DNA-methyltransferase (cytosine-N4-specific)